MISGQVQSGGASWTKFEHFLMKIQSDLGIPTPFPTVGGVLIPDGSMFTTVLSWFTPRQTSPTSVGFPLTRNRARAASGQAVARPRRTGDTTGSPTDGFTCFPEM
jgi:hypothetical protein